MKIGIIGDIHFSEYSSILRDRGYKFSARLENCVASINWAEQVTEMCDQIVYLGDFFDKSTLNAEELTALSYIKWNNRYHRFLVGNHEMGINTLEYSSAHILDLGVNGEVVDKAYLSFYDEGTELCFLPYILEADRKPLSEYFREKSDYHRIIFSHNDIAGIQMGPIISKAGFSIDEIESYCDYFINGHLHNGMPITSKIINLGNLTGQNFSEDGFKYSHNIMILDTDSMQFEIIRNPYAINFYKIEDLQDLERVTNAVVTVKVFQDQVEEARQLLNQPNIIASRLLIDYSSKSTEQADIKVLRVDHLDEFRKFVLEEVKGVDPDLLREELNIIYG